MSLAEAYGDGFMVNLRARAAQPLEPVEAAPKYSAWSVVPRFLAAAGAEIGANALDLASAYGQVSAAMGQNSLLPDDKETRKQRLEAFETLKTEGIDFRPEEAQPLYEFARDLRPDPLTAGAAEQVIFSVGKGLTKAIGSAVIAGPVGGATTFGVSEGMTTAEDLAEQGVDQATRAKVGAVTGVISGASIALPVAGQTTAQTIGLIAAGGPASFVAQQLATREILSNADYGELAQQYDPLDPVGLAVSTLLPAGFAIYARRAATGPKPTQAQIDAAMVHNVTMARDAAEDGNVRIERGEGDAVLQEMGIPPDALPKAEEVPENITAPRLFDEPAETVQAEQAEPMADPLAARVEALREASPDFAVPDDDGAPVSLVERLEAVKKAAQEGTDDELGALDADLLRVAAECAIATGA